MTIFLPKRGGKNVLKTLFRPKVGKVKWSSPFLEFATFPTKFLRALNRRRSEHKDFFHSQTKIKTTTTTKTKTNTVLRRSKSPTLGYHQLKYINLVYHQLYISSNELVGKSLF